MSYKVKDGLFIGDAEAAIDEDFLRMNGICAIVNCMSHVNENEYYHGFQYQSWTLSDHTDNVFDGPVFDEMYSFIQKKLKNDINVLVHCDTGEIIAPCVILGYLMKCYSWGVDKSHEFLVQKSRDAQYALPRLYIDQLYNLEQSIIDERSLYESSTEICKKLNEWHPKQHIPGSDEHILINTYLNAILPKPVESPDSTVCSHSRSVSWIDTKLHLRTSLRCPMKGIVKPERPPNACYSSVNPGNGWVHVDEQHKRRPSIIYQIEDDLDFASLQHIEPEQDNVLLQDSVPLQSSNNSKGKGKKNQNKRIPVHLRHTAASLSRKNHAQNISKNRPSSAPLHRETKSTTDLLNDTFALLMDNNMHVLGSSAPSFQSKKKKPVKARPSSARSRSPNNNQGKQRPSSAKMSKFASRLDRTINDGNIARQQTWK